MDGHVAEFASIAVATAVDVAVDDDTATNAGADGVINEVVGVFARAKCEFTECAYVGVVVDDCGDAEFVLDDFWKGAVVPSCYVCGVDDALCVKVDGATKTDAARGDGRLCNEGFAFGQDLVDPFLRVVCAVGWALDVFDYEAFCCGKREAKLGAADVDCEDHVVASASGDGFNIMRRTSNCNIPAPAMATIIGLDAAL